VAGGTPDTLASMEASPLDLVVDATNVYWVDKGTAQANYLDGKVRMVAK